MDSITFVFTQFNPFTTTIIIILFPLLTLHLITTLKSSHQAGNIPPGPKPWPLIGNLPHFIRKNPHITVTNLAKLHGPLMSLKLGTQTIILASSPDMARQVLKTHDRELSARRAPKATPITEAELKRFSLLWATDCSPHWKDIRVLWKAELFSNRAMDARITIREKKVAEMVEYIRESKVGEGLKIGEIVFAVVYNALGNLCFSRDMVGLGDEESARDWKGTFWRFMECATTPVVADFYPGLDGLGLDFLGKKSKAGKCMKKLFDVWEGLIRERREVVFGKQYGDFLGFMLENEFSNVQIQYMLLEILPAGAGTLVSTIEWAMAELIKNKNAMNRLQQELKNHKILSSTSIKESQLSQLPYLNACVKETLRLHPPIAFLPHCAQSTCQVMDYTIPKSSFVFVNLWAKGHDPKVWEDPFLFKPERFLDSNLDFKGQDYEFLPFGSGRRMCPGMPFANKQVHLILASLLGSFEWSLPKDGDPLELDMNEKYAVPLRKEKPLVLIPHLHGDM